MQTKISLIHGAVKRGSLLVVQKLVSEDPKSKLILAKDSTGTPLLHKAVYYDHLDIVEWLVQNYPSTVSLKDKVVCLFIWPYLIQWITLKNRR